MTLPLVPGGPDPSRNGFSNFMPLTVMLRSARSVMGPPRRNEKRVGYHGEEYRSTRNSQAPSDLSCDTDWMLRAWGQWLGVVAFAVTCAGCDTLLGLTPPP